MAGNWFLKNTRLHASVNAAVNANALLRESLRKHW